MDVINKLYNTVSSTVSQISSVLPGNPLSKDFDIYEQIASAGPGLLWKVHKGFKRSTKQESSIFVFEKRQLDVFRKEEREIMINILKRSIVQLTKLRHPKILTVYHPLEESRDSIAFATEPIFSSLANVLGNYNNLSNTVTQKLQGYKLYDVEIKCGLLHLIEGLSFLHTDVKLLHKNICPESIIINKEGNWKIFGFDYCELNDSTDDNNLHWKFQTYNCTYHSLTQPNLEYMAPENILNSEHSTKSDIYSLGVLIYTIYSVNHKPFKVFGKDIELFKQFAKDLRNGKYPNLSIIPTNLSDFVMLMINSSPNLRPSTNEFSKIAYFDEVDVKALCYLDSLFQWDNLQKSQFYKKLPQILKQLPHRVNIQHIMPCLVKEFINPQMIPFVLPNVLFIAEQCTQAEYNQHLSEHIKKIMKIVEPMQIMLILLKNFETILKFSSPEDITINILPMLTTALQINVFEIQELSLSLIPTLISKIDYFTIHRTFLPKIKNLCLETRNSNTKVHCLICIGKLMEKMDRHSFSSDIVPFIVQIPAKDAATVMAIIAIFKIALSNTKIGISKELIATKVIPYLMPLCVANDLSMQQFNIIILMVKDMVQQVESEHRTKLKKVEIHHNSGLPNLLEILDKQPQTSEATPDSSINSVTSFLNELDLKNTTNKETNSTVRTTPFYNPTTISSAATSMTSSKTHSTDDKGKNYKKLTDLSNLTTSQNFGNVNSIFDNTNFHNGSLSNFNKSVNYSNIGLANNSFGMPTSITSVPTLNNNVNLNFTSNSSEPFLSNQFSNSNTNIKNGNASQNSSSTQLLLPNRQSADKQKPTNVLTNQDILDFLN